MYQDQSCIEPSDITILNETCHSIKLIEQKDNVLCLWIDREQVNVPIPKRDGTLHFETQFTFQWVHQFHIRTCKDNDQFLIVTICFNPQINTHHATVFICIKTKTLYCSLPCSTMNENRARYMIKRGIKEHKDGAHLRISHAVFNEWGVVMFGIHTKCYKYIALMALPDDEFVEEQKDMQITVLDCGDVIVSCKSDFFNYFYFNLRPHVSMSRSTWHSNHDSTASPASIRHDDSASLATNKSQHDKKHSFQAFNNMIRPSMLSVSPSSNGNFYADSDILKHKFVINGTIAFPILSFSYFS